MQHLFHNLKYCSAKPITGVGGKVIPKVTSFGILVFMGKIIKAYYPPDISKSVISEGFICRYYSFKFTRDEN